MTAAGDSAPDAPRFGIVGARRARSGLGPFVARELERAGARVVAFAGTREESVREAGVALAEQGVFARGYLGKDAMLAAERLDALAILSPHAAHAGALEAALEARLHVLCEKPLVWGGPDPAGQARRLVDAFDRAALVLAENCQWPYAIPSFERLHPGAVAGATTFAMRLSPGETGLAMLIDSLPHPVSLLQRIAGAAEGRVESVRVVERSADERRAILAFDWVAGGRRIGSRVELVGGSAPPRTVWLEISGRRAERSVDARDWTLALEHAGRREPLPDPMAALARDVVDAVRDARAGRRPPRAAAVAARMDALAAIVAAYPGPPAGGSIGK